MRKIICGILLLAGSFTGAGQSLDLIIQSIQQNNPRLMALQKWLEAEETRSKTGIYPHNPEIRYTYLWGNPEAMGDQRELEIMQSFRLPGYYASKSAIQKLEFNQTQAMALKEQREILHTARATYYRLVFLRKQEALLRIKKGDAEKLVSLMQEGLTRGEISKPAFDKARIYAMGVHAEWQKTITEMEIQRQHLQHLNGGLPVEGTAFEYPMRSELPPLDSLLATLSSNNPDMIMARIQVQQAEQSETFQRQNNWPSFEAGYKSETFMDQKLQGIHAGITIPLWQNAKTVKQAQLNTAWTNAYLAQQESETARLVSGLYHELVALKTTLDQMQSVITEEQISASSFELLESGQISFTEYLMDTDFIWDIKIQMLLYENTYFELWSKLETYL